SGTKIPDAISLDPEFRSAGGNPDVIQRGSDGARPRNRAVCGPNPQRYYAGRSSSPAADQVRVSNQPQDRQGTGPHRATGATRACGHGDRIRPASLWYSVCSLALEPNTALAAYTPASGARRDLGDGGPDFRVRTPRGFKRCGLFRCCRGTSRHPADRPKTTRL